MSHKDQFLAFYAQGPHIQAPLDKAESLGGQDARAGDRGSHMVTYAFFADLQGLMFGPFQSQQP